jgi:NTE family protein
MATEERAEVAKRGAPAGTAAWRIGLCLLEGGYRAAAFHLGTLDLLQRGGLLAGPLALLTISGGRFTGCA